MDKKQLYISRFLQVFQNKKDELTYPRQDLLAVLPLLLSVINFEQWPSGMGPLLVEACKILQINQEMSQAEMQKKFDEYYLKHTGPRQLFLEILQQTTELGFDTRVIAEHFKQALQKRSR